MTQSPSEEAVGVPKMSEGTPRVQAATPAGGNFAANLHRGGSQKFATKILALLRTLGHPAQGVTAWSPSPQKSNSSPQRLRTTDELTGFPLDELHTRSDSDGYVRLFKW